MSTTGQISTRPGTEADGDDLWRILTEALASGRSRAWTPPRPVSRRSSSGPATSALGSSPSATGA